MILGCLTIPKYPISFEKTKGRRPKYYTRDCKIPKKYQDKKRYKWKKFGKNYHIYDKINKERPIRNKAYVNKPRTVKLSGNDLTSGYGSPHTRAFIVRSLKDFYRPYVQQYVKDNGQITQFPIQVEWDFYTTVESANFDMSNFWFYYKYFEDCLFETRSPNLNSDQPDDLIPLIPDDNAKYVTKPGAPRLCPVDNWEDRKFVFTFIYDNRNMIQNHPIWSNND